MAAPARTTHAAATAMEYGDRVVLSTVRDVHRAVSRRVFGATRVVGGRGPELVHDGVTASIYEGLSFALRAGGAGLRSLGHRGVGGDLDDGVGRRRLRATVNGLIGAELAARDDPQAISMAVRHDRRDLSLTPAAVRAAFPDATDRLVVFLHGLVESDDSWAATRPGSVAYPERVAADTRHTPVLLRYNTGLNVSTNGEHLSRLVEDLVAAWPVGVSSIAFVGHSMGGLVVRAATNHAVADRRTWPDLVDHVVCLGTPHLGANLERVAHLGSRALAALPESAPFGTILDTRSPGIVDLRHGYISRDEWDGQDLTRQWGLDRIAAAPLPHAEYHFVAATLGRAPSSPLSRLLGDLLVHPASAAGDVGDGTHVVDGAEVRHLGGVDHFALLRHPRIADWLVGWLGSAPPLALAATASARD